MEELVKFIAKSLVANPDAVVTSTKEADGEIVISLKVAPEDMGRVIGREGRIAKSIRTIVYAASATSDTRYRVDIEE